LKAVLENNVCSELLSPRSSAWSSLKCLYKPILRLPRERLGTQNHLIRILKGVQGRRARISTGAAVGLSTDGAGCRGCSANRLHRRLRLIRPVVARAKHSEH